MKGAESCIKILKAFWKVERKKPFALCGGQKHDLKLTSKMGQGSIYHVLRCDDGALLDTTVPQLFNPLEYTCVWFCYVLIRLIVQTDF